MTESFSKKKIKDFIFENIVTIIFWVFIIVGFIVSQGITFNWFLTELSNRFYRNAFLVLSLIIPVVAGLGLNFGIVVGAIAGQLAIIIVRYMQYAGYWELSGFVAFLLCLLFALPIATLFGWLTGMLYNKTRGQEMIASLIVGFFGNGIYQFIILFAVGAIIPVMENHQMILPDGVGIRMSLDMGNIKYSLENIWQIKFHVFMTVAATLVLLFLIYRQFIRKLKPGETRMHWLRFGVYAAVCLVIAGLFGYNWATGGRLTMVKKVPMGTVIMIALLAVFTKWIMGTKLGQDFRACGQNQHIAASNGINVDKTRIVATIISTVLASWGQILYLQNTGTMAVYSAHNQIGFFAVAAILVGGASVKKATVSQAFIGTLLFQSMFILSPELCKVLFGQAVLGEYFRTFMVYGVIGLALGLYVWKANKAKQLKLEPRETPPETPNEQ